MTKTNLFRRASVVVVLALALSACGGSAERSQEDQLYGFWNYLRSTDQLGRSDLQTLEAFTTEVAPRWECSGSGPEGYGAAWAATSTELTNHRYTVAQKFFECGEDWTITFVETAFRPGPARDLLLEEVSTLESYYPD